MKIVVCAKQVPDTTEVKLDPKTNTLTETVFQVSSIRMIRRGSKLPCS